MKNAGMAFALLIVLAVGVIIGSLFFDSTTSRWRVRKGNYSRGRHEISRDRAPGH